ncbi:MAG: hypothetical protein AAGA56_04290 [Myxococcota bacterium]
MCWLACATTTMSLGCQAEPREELDVGVVTQPLAVAGPWAIPDDVLAAGDEQYVSYTGAGPWVGEENCGGGILSGTDILRDYLLAYFPQTNTIGGYNCRPIRGNDSQMSVHATGRALDIMLPVTEDGDADNSMGDPIGNWLIQNAEAIGIQFIIWDKYTWGAARTPGEKGRAYGGASPHVDHLHIELSVEKAELTTNWFETVVTPPILDGCLPLPSAGGLIDDGDPCFIAVGPEAFWRVTDEGGHDGAGVHWTNAWQNEEPSNWARYNLSLSARGQYEVEVFIDPEWGVHRTARYAVAHAEGEALVVVDQGTESGWVSLGAFSFAAGPGRQYVSVFDNEDYDVGDDQRIAVDAIRLTHTGEWTPPTAPEPEMPIDDEVEAADPAAPEAAPEVESGGCAARPSGTRNEGWSGLFVLAAFGWFNRRAARRSRVG